MRVVRGAENTICIDMTMYLVHYIVMLMVNIHDAKAHLSEYLNRLEHEGEIVLCKRNQPVAVIRPVAAHARSRAIGLEREQFKVPEAFFEVLPKDLLSLYDGHGA